METETTLTLEIYGYLWSGPRSVYSYSLPPGTTVTDDNVKRFAGDFESVLDWRLIRTTHSYERKSSGLFSRTDLYKTLRGFRNGMTPQRFYRLANS